MGYRAAAWICTFAIVIPGPALAASFDGSKPLLCAAVETQQCELSAACKPETLGNLDAPRFLRISVQSKKITGTRPSGGAIDAPIALVRHSQDMMFLQGTQDEFLWNIVVGEADGKMVLTVADNDDALVIFGECTLQ